MKETVRNKFLPSINKLQIEKVFLKNETVEIKKKNKKLTTGNYYSITDANHNSEFTNKNKLNEILNTKINSDNKRSTTLVKNAIFNGSRHNNNYSINISSNNSLAYPKNKIFNTTFTKIKEKVKNLYYKDYLSKIGVNS